MIGGILTHEDWDHPRLMYARVQGDPDMLAHALAQLRPGSMAGYERIDVFQAHNLTPMVGKKAWLDMATGVLANAGLAWYFAPFSSDSTPAETWDGDLGKETGGVVTEFTGYTATDRQECEFVAATGGTTGRASTSNTTRAILTVSSGVTATVYGVGLTNNATKQYGGGGAILLSALRYPEPKVYAAGQVKLLGFELYRE